VCSSRPTRIRPITLASYARPFSKPAFGLQCGSKQSPHQMVPCLAHLNVPQSVWGLLGGLASAWALWSMGLPCLLLVADCSCSCLCCSSIYSNTSKLARLRPSPPRTHTPWLVCLPIYGLDNKPASCIAVFCQTIAQNPTRQPICCIRLVLHLRSKSRSHPFYSFVPSFSLPALARAPLPPNDTATGRRHLYRGMCCITTPLSTPCSALVLCCAWPTTTLLLNAHVFPWNI